MIVTRGPHQGRNIHDILPMPNGPRDLVKMYRELDLQARYRPRTMDLSDRQLLDSLTKLVQQHQLA